jgi:hypothetical protein
MASKRRRFTVQTPLGDTVFLTRDRWREIIKHKHPALAGLEGAVRDCLEAPTLIRESAKKPDVHLHYAPAERGHLCVVTAPSDKEERFVVTAYFTKNIKKGVELWKN